MSNPLVDPILDRPRPRPSVRPRVSPPAPTASADPTPAAAEPEPIREARMPVSELLFHRAGAASPFGDDLQFPLPAGALAYRHP